jgi:hypothetical protein
MNDPGNLPKKMKGSQDLPAYHFQLVFSEGRNIAILGERGGLQVLVQVLPQKLEDQDHVLPEGELIKNPNYPCLVCRVVLFDSG